MELPVATQQFKGQNLLLKVSIFRCYSEDQRKALKEILEEQLQYYSNSVHTFILMCFKNKSVKFCTL